MGIKNVALSNVVGFVLGVATFALVFVVTSFVFMWLLKIRLIATLLSWPASPEFWASTGVYMASLFSAYGVAEVISKPNPKGRKIGVIFLSFSILAISVLSIIGAFVYGIEGSKWSIVWMTVTSFLVFWESVKGETFII